MNPIARNRGFYPALRPLACSLMVALTSLPMSPLMARDLDGESETIEEGHDLETWRLENGAELIVNGADTYDIAVFHDSTVSLTGATVTRMPGSMSNYALSLHEAARVTAVDTRFVDAGLWITGDARIALTRSSVTIDANSPEMDRVSGYAISMNTTYSDGKPSVLLDASTVNMADKPDPTRYGSGIGANMTAGMLTLRNGSLIDAANVGVMVRSDTSRDHAIILTLDNSHIHSGRHSAIEFHAEDNASNTFDALIANGSTITAENGTLLLVRAYEDIATGNHSTIRFTVDNSRLEGDIHFDDRFMQGEVNVLLRNNASLKGAFQRVTTAGIGTGSLWTLDGDSTVGHLTLHDSGTVELGDGVNFNTLSLDSFEGLQGTLVFNTALEGDASQTDTLDISGNATGEANVVVKNAGGQGAQTERGIELITIGGQSDAVFTLQGRAAGGLYEYFLVKDDNGNWYLRSELEKEPDPEQPHPCEIDQSLPECEITLPVEPEIGLPDPDEPGTGTPVLRPEAGAYLANQAAMGQLLNGSARDRMNGATVHEGVRTWAATGHGESRMDVTGQQRLRTTQSRLQVGADLGVFDGGKGRVGAMLGAGQADATARSVVTGYSANAKIEGGSMGVYAHWSDAATLWDASLQFGRFSNRVAGEGLEVERYTSSAVQAAIEAAHRFDVGRIGSLALGLQPEVQLTYTSVRMNPHLESTGTVVERDGGNGLSARVGVRLEGEATLSAGQFRPYVALHGIHDGRDNSISFDGVTVEGALPRSRVELSAGGQVQFGRRLGGIGGISAAQGEDGYRDLAARIGITYRW